jgi:hypothetical protein
MQECTDVAEPAPEVLLPLLPFQKQFLAWGLKQVRMLLLLLPWLPLIIFGLLHVAAMWLHCGMLLMLARPSCISLLPYSHVLTCLCCGSVREAQTKTMLRSCLTKHVVNLLRELGPIRGGFITHVEDGQNHPGHQLALKPLLHIVFTLLYCTSVVSSVVASCS